DIGKTGQPRHLLVEARVVLHRARAERVETGVDRIVLLRQPGEVADDLQLAETGEPDSAFAFETAEAGFELRRFRQIDTAFARRTLFEDQRLFDLQTPVARDRVGGFTAGG